MTGSDRNNATDRPSVPLTDLVSHLADVLDPDRGRDACPNGLQVEGKPEVRRLVTGVSACAELFSRAAQGGADAILVHHGIFWEGDSRALTGLRYGRVKALIDSGTSLLAYHLPLDRHPVLGNNALGLEGLGLVDAEPFGHYDGEAIGFRGRYPEPLSADRFLSRCAEVFGQDPLSFPHGPDPVTTVGLVSGAAERLFHEAIDLGLDAFVTGEVSEWVQNVARESGTHFVAAGHYATERLGVRALGQHLAERFGLDVEFIDVPNPV